MILEGTWKLQPVSRRRGQHPLLPSRSPARRRFHGGPHHRHEPDPRRPRPPNQPRALRHSSCPFHDPHDDIPHEQILVLAIFLMILWVVLGVALAVTGVFLHLLWILAIILAILWLVGKLRGSRQSDSSMSRSGPDALGPAKFRSEAIIPRDGCGQRAMFQPRRTFTRSESRIILQSHENNHYPHFPRLGHRSPRLHLHPDDPSGRPGQGPRRTKRTSAPTAKAEYRTAKTMAMTKTTTTPMMTTAGGPTLPARARYSPCFRQRSRGQGYYYGPPNSPYYYESPDTRYYSNREAAPREYYQNQGYGRSESSSVQRELAQRGYYDGSIDGQIGPQSSRSIARYQRDQGLQETGNISESLLQSLGLR